MLVMVGGQMWMEEVEDRLSVPLMRTLRALSSLTTPSWMPRLKW